MTDKRTIPMGKGPRSIDEFVRTGAVSPDHTSSEAKVDVERDVTKTFRMPESLGRRLKVYAARTGQKEKDILIRLITDYLKEHDTVK